MKSTIGPTRAVSRSGLLTKKWITLSQNGSSGRISPRRASAMIFAQYSSPAPTWSRADEGKGVGREQKGGRGLLGQRGGRAGAADFPAAADMEEPVAMRRALLGRAFKPGRIQERGNVVFRQKVARQRAEL